VEKKGGSGQLLGSGLGIDRKAKREVSERGSRTSGLPLKSENKKVVGETGTTVLASTIHNRMSAREA